MKRVWNPRSEGRRIFRNFMDLPPLCDLDNIEVASNNVQVVASDMVDASSETSDNMLMSFENEVSDNTTSDEADDSSNNLNADNEVLDNLASDSMQMSSNNSDNVALDNLASDSMGNSSNDGVLDTLTLQAVSTEN
ncbi:hypothetical protein TNCV_5110271 [Trichonephila clavipes]|nr:hypothetical protein TNCV_5110271 [Trichonephila clavipes]